MLVGRRGTGEVGACRQPERWDDRYAHLKGAVPSDANAKAAVAKLHRGAVLSVLWEIASLNKNGRPGKGELLRRPGPSRQGMQHACDT